MVLSLSIFLSVGSLRSSLVFLKSIKFFMLLGAWSLLTALKTVQTIFASLWLVNNSKPILLSSSW